VSRKDSMRYTVGVEPRLCSAAFSKARAFLLNEARPLEAALFAFDFEGAPAGDVLSRLRIFQNADGGFGKALESDFRLPASSPMASSVGLRHLLALPDSPSRRAMIEAAVGYLESGYDQERGAWYAVPPSVNDYPHAPWWHSDESSGHTPIDAYWGNPSAELIGQLYACRYMLKRLDAERLVAAATAELNGRDSYGSPHELYCYIRLYAALPQGLAFAFKASLYRGVAQHVDADPAHWGDYVPAPLKFLPLDSDERFGIRDEAISAHLDWLVERLEAAGVLEPNWSWGAYEDAWRQARIEWTGVLTLEALRWLKRFGRLPG